MHQQNAPNNATSAEARLEQIRATLAADGYGLSVATLGESTRVTVSSASGLCDDCLVPKDLLLGMLEPALGVPASQIELLYPDELNS